jgi:hypothetical protein
MISRPASRAAPVAVLCRRAAATAEDDALERADASTAELAAPDNCPADALTTGTAEAPEEAADALFEANRRPLESRSRLMRCRSVPISAACW